MCSDLRFNEDGNIKIMQLTDLHYTNDDEADHKTVALMRQALKDEKPDFVIVTGDMVYGEHNLEFLPKVFAPLIESGCPWSFVFGNHDSEWGHSRTELLDAGMRMKGCMASHDSSSIDGVGNHVIEIKDKNNKTKWAVFAIDSGDYNPMEQVGGYACVTRNQINWYQNKIYELKELRDRKSVV